MNKGEKGLLDRLMIDRSMIIKIDRQIDCKIENKG